MKIKQLLLPVIALCMTTYGNAAVTVTQFVGWSDGNDGPVPDATVSFDVVTSNSILIATIYVDTATPGPLISNVRFGNGGGIGSGDVAPTLTFSDSRLLSYVFINPSTSDGLSFRLDNSTSSVGIAAALYEVSGAITALASITAATASTSISTTTASELVVSFAGRNAAAPSLGASTIFAGTDIAIAGGTVTGTGSVASASATAPAIGSQNIEWTGNNAAGRIAYAFEAAAVIPEPSTVFLGGLGLLALFRRRR